MIKIYVIHDMLGCRELKEEIFIRERRFLLCVCPAHAKKYLNVNRICESVKNRHKRHTQTHAHMHTHYTHIQRKRGNFPQRFRPEMVFIYRTVLYFIAPNTRRSRTHEMIALYVYSVYGVTELTIHSSGKVIAI